MASEAAKSETILKYWDNTSSILDIECMKLRKQVFVKF